MNFCSKAVKAPPSKARSRFHLSSAEGKNRDENFPSFFDAVVNLLEEVALPAPLRVPDGRGVGRLRDEQVWTAFVDPS